jgi:hypothetical protein
LVENKRAGDRCRWQRSASKPVELFWGFYVANTPIASILGTPASHDAGQINGRFDRKNCTLNVELSNSIGKPIRAKSLKL